MFEVLLMPKLQNLVVAMGLSLFVVGCGGGGGSSSSDPDPSPTPTVSPEPELGTTYSFESKFDESESSVSYTGQTARHALIAALFRDIESIDGTQTFDISERVNLYFAGCAAATISEGTLVCPGDNEVGIENHGIEFTDFDVEPGSTFDSISSNKDLRGKIAGNDREAHILGDGFFGWDEGLEDGATPEQLVHYWTEQLEATATAASGRTVNVNGAESEINVGYVDTFGRDYSQLMQKFLLGAVALSQGTADYLAGIFGNDNSAPEEDKFYTEAEHNWDEAFGYFGAPRDYDDYEPAEIASTVFHDTDEDGAIDLRSEYAFGASTNCAKRDRDTLNMEGISAEPTTFKEDAFEAFVEGRRLIAEHSGTEFSDEDEAAIDAQIEIAAVTWEKCLAATAVHYINDVITDISTIQTDSSSGFTSLDHFKDYAKHWSELKGFALSLQFNPRSPFRTSDVVSIADLENLLSVIGDAPVMDDGTQAGVAYEGGTAAYVTALEGIRTTLQTAYDFEEEHVVRW